MLLRKEYSQLDQSVNFIHSASVGYFEARYVRRTPKYFITYLSSQSGCNMGCNFCHLTATGQTKFINAEGQDYIDQAKLVFQHYTEQPEAEVVHFNFMARGDVFANPWVLMNGRLLCARLTDLASNYDLIPKLKFSTIMPRKTMRDVRLAKIFKGYTPDIYLSLYSMREEFRKRWMPAALDPYQALDKLVEYQQDTNKIPRIHYALISNENCTERDAHLIIKALKDRDLKVKFNMVAYNSPNDQSREAYPESQQAYAKILTRAGYEVKMVERVGFDVAASCGLFVGGKNNALERFRDL